MVGIYIAAWAACILGVALHRKFAFSIGPHMLRGPQDGASLTFMEIAALLLVFLLLTANRTGLDIIGYVKTYENAHAIDSGKEFIYALLSLAAHKLGLSFFMYRAALTLLSGLLAIATVKKTGADMGFVLLFYLPSMVFEDSMQFRNAVALAIFLWSFQYLIFQGKYAAVKYVVCVLVIAQIHTVYYFALIMAVCFIKNRRKQIAACLCILGIFITVATACNGNRIPFFILLSRLFLVQSDLRGVKYYTSGHLGWVVPTAIHSITALLGLTINRYMHRGNRGIAEITKCQLEYLDIVAVYNQALFLTVPAIMMNMHYYRLVRGAFMMNVVGASFLFQKGRGLGRFQAFTLSVLILLAALWCVLDLAIIEDTATMAAPVLHGVLFFLP